MQIVIGLSVAFGVLMIVEGLRYSFLPNREANTEIGHDRPSPQLPTRTASPPNRKRDDRVVKRSRLERPKIRRAAQTSDPASLPGD